MSTARPKQRILFLSTVPESLWHFARPHWPALQKEGYFVIAVSSAGEKLERCLVDGADEIHAVKMARAITPGKDLLAIVRLTRFLLRRRPTVVHTHTPKAGLIGMVSAALAGIDVRIYTFNGALWLVGPRWKRLLLRAVDAIGCHLATSVVCVSASLRAAVIGAGVCEAGKIQVLGPGSSHGVNTVVFDPLRLSADEREATRCQLQLPQGARVLGFVGRLNPDKGIGDLHQTWLHLREEFPNLYLLLVGPTEPPGRGIDYLSSRLDQDARVRRLSVEHEQMPSIYSVMDVCALPSYREGFPNVALEAASMRVPVVTTTAVGCCDAVIEGVTGFLVPPRDPAALAGRIADLLRSELLRSELGRSARTRAVQEFSEPVISQHFLAHYRRLLDSDVATDSSIDRRRSANAAMPESPSKG